VVYATKKTDDFNKLGIKRTGFRSDHESLKKDLSALKDEIEDFIGFEKLLKNDLRDATENDQLDFSDKVG
jgi:hypothetical protein